MTTTNAPPAAGVLFVIAAPSGGGKSSMVNALLAREPGIRLSISWTTRPPRLGESEGQHYHFVDEPAFRKLLDAGEFLEHANVYGNWYATSATWLQSQLACGQDVLLEIDWQGAAQVRKLIPDSVHVFILPPSLAALNERLVKRGQDSPAVIARRLDGAFAEIRHWQEFDYVIINQDFATAVDDLAAIVRAARLVSSRQGLRHSCLIAELLEPRS